MFTASGDTMIAKTKARLKTQLIVELTTRKISQDIQYMIVQLSFGSYISY